MTRVQLGKLSDLMGFSRRLVELAQENEASPIVVDPWKFRRQADQDRIICQRNCRGDVNGELVDRVSRRWVHCHGNFLRLTLRNCRLPLG